MRSFLQITLFIGAFTLFTGCYTQLTVVDTSPPPEESVEWVVDSATGDTVKVIREVDTIETDDGRTCVWEQDLMGYPHLRCYDSFYPRDWYYYNYSPWWYRNDPYWYDYRRCPRYYYYDPSCGCCRYTTSSYHHRRYHRNDGNVTERREPSKASGSSFRSRGVPEGGTPHKKSSSSGTSTRSVRTGSVNKNAGEEITVTNEKTKKKTVIRKRSRGVPESGAKPSSTKKKHKKKSATTQSSSPPPAPAPSNSNVSPSSGSHSSPPPSSPPKNGGDDRPKRRRSRSW